MRCSTVGITSPPSPRFLCVPLLEAVRLHPGYRRILLVGHVADAAAVQSLLEEFYHPDRLQMRCDISLTSTDVVILAPCEPSEEIKRLLFDPVSACKLQQAVAAHNMATLIKILSPCSFTCALNSLSTYPQVWNGRVRYVFGSPLVAEDMRLVHAEVADACFMLCSKVSFMPGVFV